MPVPVIKEYALHIAGRKSPLLVYSTEDLCDLNPPLGHVISIKATGCCGLGADHHPTYDGVEKPGRKR